MSDKLRAWIQASRAPFFVATLIPLGLGGVIAATENKWDPLRWAVVLFASFLVHLCTNLANDYFEYESGVDEGDSLGGSRVLQEGKITHVEIRNALILLYAIAGACGVWIVWVSRAWVLAPLMLFAFFSSVFYTAPPIRYGWLGLGELLVGVNMGVIMTAGAAAALTGALTERAVLLSIPVALMVASILYYQSLSDIDDDRAVGKNTIAVRLGRERAIWGYRFFVFASTLSMVTLVIAGLVHPLALISLLTLIPAYRIDERIRAAQDWRDLHDKGAGVRLFYLANGITLICAVYFR